MKKPKQGKSVVSAYVTAGIKAKLIKKAKRAKSKSVSSYIAELLEREVSSTEKGE